MYVNNSGFTLIEVLIACLIIPFCLSLGGLMLKLMVNFTVVAPEQMDVSLIQISQSINQSSNYCIKDNRFTYSFDNRIFHIMKVKDTLVKRPGWDILLERVEKFDVTEKSINVCTSSRCEKLDVGIHFNLGTLDYDLCDELD